MQSAGWSSYDCVLLCEVESSSAAERPLYEDVVISTSQNGVLNITTKRRQYRRTTTNLF